jgi:hypothetical protein
MKTKNDEEEMAINGLGEDIIAEVEGRPIIMEKKLAFDGLLAAAKKSVLNTTLKILLSAGPLVPSEAKEALRMQSESYIAILDSMETWPENPITTQMALLISSTMVLSYDDPYTVDHLTEKLMEREHKVISEGNNPNRKEIWQEEGQKAIAAWKSSFKENIMLAEHRANKKTE